MTIQEKVQEHYDEVVAMGYDQNTHLMKKNYMENNLISIDQTVQPLMDSTIVMLIKHYFQEELREIA